ncbi:MAG TPA: 1-deoxy-D-xylulose-5-phosphate reductoisomerase, partial [Spirochaetes bacterium]|nr:1-deoxy-D-xylulose-5-phosphate reductoisomerase [Spirochaetota bacterium]
VVSAIVGSAGLLPTLEAIPHTGRIALANKETLVMGGDLVKEKIREYGVDLVPVDSEHSAVFTLLERLDRRDVARIVLTASGGSLRDLPVGRLPEATPAEALAHPTWSMGKKITIDSATLMNKGLEVIEAHHLFDMDYSAIDVLVHPESLVHSMVETRDGGIHAYLGVADMALPVLYALLYPEKRENPFGRLDLAKAGKLTFRSVDPARYPSLRLCYEAGRRGGAMPAVLNGANETAVQAYLDGKIRFTDIVSTVEKTMGLYSPEAGTGLNEIMNADAWARETAYGITRG